GLYLLCGKHETNETEKEDRSDNLHDIANSFQPRKKVRPFAELMTMTAYNVNDDSMMDLILEALREEKNN
ncbi:MAG: hypothetical protein K2G25_03475, partial [Oscillospiraceae bacterium]|nr:hypothetical protein [Oscillospiraceae bacterium]